LLPLLLAIAVFTVFFTATHAWVIARVEPDFNRAFKLSRGIAALMLTVVGFIGVLSAIGHWRTGFLYSHEADDILRFGVAMAYGHLLSDFIWMAKGRSKHQIKPRLDLLIHHGLGAIAYAYSMYVEVGYALVMLSLASEIMPCFTGLEAWGRHRDRPGTQLVAARARLLVLMFWRIPLWAFALTMLWSTALGGHMQPGLEFIYKFSITCLTFLLGLDVYWVKKCAAAWTPPTVTT
jgi:hypothetical protein